MMMAQLRILMMLLEIASRQLLTILQLLPQLRSQCQQAAPLGIIPLAGGTRLVISIPTSYMRRLTLALMAKFRFITVQQEAFR